MSYIPERDVNGKTLHYTSPFADKILPDGKKLYKRVHGVKHTCAVGNNDIIYTVTYPHAKMIGTEIVWGEVGDCCDFMVLDDDAGTYSGIPGEVLNQFGFCVNIAAGKHVEKSAYDADIYAGMKIKVVFNSVSAKDIGVNFDLNEVKD